MNLKHLKSYKLYEASVNKPIKKFPISLLLIINTQREDIGKEFGHFQQRNIVIKVVQRINYKNLTLVSMGWNQQKTYYIL